MRWLSKAFVLALVFLAMPLVPDTGKAASLTIEIREPDGAGGTRPVPGIDVTITHLETGKTETVRTDRRGRARFRKQPGGHYEIDGYGRREIFTTYRRLGESDDFRLRISSDGSTPGYLLSTPTDLDVANAIAFAKKGDRSGVDRILKFERTRLKHDTQALMALNRVFDSARDGILKNIPKFIQARLKKELAAAPRRKHLSILRKYETILDAQITAVRRKLSDFTKHHRATNGRSRRIVGKLKHRLVWWEAKRKALRSLMSMYAIEKYYRSEIKHAFKIIETINRGALQKAQPKPASQGVRSPRVHIPAEPALQKAQPKPASQVPAGGYNEWDPPSCFIAGTRVLMADGTSRNIESVRIGEKVRGKNGAVNTVTGIERPRLGGRLLYAINGGRAFVTAEHPFWTSSGWKSIDPRATFAENPRLNVGTLAVGDRIAAVAPRAEPRLAAAGGGAVAASYAPARLKTIAVRSILGVTGDPRTTVYNLLLDGDHTYFADGFLVHNKGG